MANNSRYMLYKKVARGGMAEIYLGKQIGEDGFQRICCIKRILPHYAHEPEFIEMFRDEAHICKRLQHANIVRVEGFEEVEGSYAIIMEYINGGDLRTLLASCEKQNVNLTVPMALYIIAEVARGLHYAHCKIDDLTGKPLEIVHRDISPQNILVSFEGEVKVTDFGIADADNKETETKPGIVKGKYSYMSPEQISAASVDARTDVFALSIVMWEMLAMKRLFHGDNEVMTIQKVRSCQIEEDIRTLNPEIDDQLYELISKGLEKDPRDRFSSAAELEKSLRKYISTTYSDFTVTDLVDFTKKTMQARLLESQAEIKSLLIQRVTVASLGLSNAQLQRASGFTAAAAPASQSPDTRLPKSGRKNLAKVPDSSNLDFSSPSTQSQPYARGSRQMGFNTNASRVGYVGTGINNAGAYSGMNPAPNMRRQGAKRQRKPEPKSGLGVAFLTAILFIVIGVLGVVVYQKKFAGPSLGQIKISSEPNRIKVNLDGAPLFSGQYAKTPITFTPMPGKENRYRVQSLNLEDSVVTNPDTSHTIIASRTGFKDEHYSFKVNRDVKKFLVLDKQIDTAPTRIRLKSQRYRTVWVRMDDGEIADEVKSSDPYEARDITFGQSHVFWIFPHGFQSKRGIFSCQVTPRSKNWIAPFLIDVYPEIKKCRTPVE